ncbi:MAG TPA: hypothetical protein PLX85_06130 [Dehalococcoidia bacterium]|nr:hypothetical protein [Dehalococcoidia bacterium]
MAITAQAPSRPPAIETTSDLVAALEQTRAKIERLHVITLRVHAENADLRAEVRGLRMEKERLQGALRRAADDIETCAEEHAADLRVRAAALRREAERGSAALL